MTEELARRRLSGVEDAKRPLPNNMVPLVESVGERSPETRALLAVVEFLVGCNRAARREPSRFLAHGDSRPHASSTVPRARAGVVSCFPGKEAVRVHQVGDFSSSTVARLQEKRGITPSAASTAVAAQ